MKKAFAMLAVLILPIFTSLACETTDVSGGPTGAQNLEFKGKTFVYTDAMAMYITKTVNVKDTVSNTSTDTITNLPVAIETVTLSFLADGTYTNTTEYKCTAEFSTGHTVPAASGTTVVTTISYQDSGNGIRTDSDRFYYSTTTNYSGYAADSVLYKKVEKGKWRQFEVDSDGFEDVTKKVAFMQTSVEETIYTGATAVGGGWSKYYDATYVATKLTTTTSNVTASESILKYSYVGLDSTKKAIYTFNDDSKKLFILQK